MRKVSKKKQRGMPAELGGTQMSEPPAATGRSGRHAPGGQADLQNGPVVKHAAGGAGGDMLRGSLNVVHPVEYEVLTFPDRV